MNGFAWAIGYLLGYLVGVAALRVLTFGEFRAGSWRYGEASPDRVYFDRDHDGRIIVHRDLVVLLGLIISILAALAASQAWSQLAG